GIIDEWTGGCMVVLTDTYWRVADFFDTLGYTFLGKGDTGVQDLEGKSDGGRGQVTHGDNGVALK
ncbi:hypothetical protein KI387_007623, partial [Taxus chinensis]